MAQKIQTLYIDDIDGSEAEGTVLFSLDGSDYEIDLNTEHAKELRAAVAPFIEKARRVSGAGRQAGRGRHKPAVDGISNSEVRSWAKTEGINLKERGRIPADVVAKYKAARGRQQRTGRG